VKDKFIRSFSLTQETVDIIEKMAKNYKSNSDFLRDAVLFYYNNYAIEDSFDVIKKAVHEALDERENKSL